MITTIRSFDLGYTYYQLQSHLIAYNFIVQFKGQPKPFGIKTFIKNSSPYD